MASSLSPGPETFTLNRLHAVWREGLLASHKRSMYSDVQYDANNELKYMRKFCLNLQASVQDPLVHRERIDVAFAPFLIARFIGDVSADVVCVFLIFFSITCHSQRVYTAARVHSVPLPYIKSDILCPYMLNVLCRGGQKPPP